MEIKIIRDGDKFTIDFFGKTLNGEIAHQMFQPYGETEPQLYDEYHLFLKDSWFVIDVNEDDTVNFFAYELEEWLELSGVEYKHTSHDYDCDDCGWYSDDIYDIPSTGAHWYIDGHFGYNSVPGNWYDFAVGIGAIKDE